MLPYQENRKLEELLGSLFKDDDGSTLEGIVILNWPGLPVPFSNCCSYSYGSY